MPTISEPRTVTATADALGDFRLLLWGFHDAARRAEKIQRLPEPYKALAACIVKLSGLRPRLIDGEPETEDFEALIANLEFVALAVDPLVHAIGVYARTASGVVNARAFEVCISDALTGPIAQLKQAQRRCEEKAAAQAAAVRCARAPERVS